MIAQDASSTSKQRQKIEWNQCVVCVCVNIYKENHCVRSRLYCTLVHRWGTIRRGGGGSGGGRSSSDLTEVDCGRVAVPIVAAQLNGTAHAVVLLALMLQQARLPHGHKVTPRKVTLVLLVARMLEHVAPQVAQKVWRVPTIGPRTSVSTNAAVTSTLVFGSRTWWSSHEAIGSSCAIAWTGTVVFESAEASQCRRSQTACFRTWSSAQMATRAQRMR